MILFAYLAPIILIFLVVLYRESFLKTKKNNYVLFVLLFSINFITYCFGIYEVCQYAGEIRTNGKIKIFLNSLLQPYDKSSPIEAMVKIDKDYFLQYLVLTLCIAALFVFIIVLSKFMFRKILIRLAIFILSISCMFCTFIMCRNWINYFNDTRLSVEAQRIKDIVDDDNKNYIQHSILRKKLKQEISRFNKAYLNKENPISRLQSLRIDMEKWSKMKDEHE